MRDTDDGIILRDGMQAMNFAEVTAMLACSYWSKGIGEEEVRQGAAHSALVTGAFLPDGRQVGYARVISDKTRFAYILDVYIDEAQRGRGVGTRLIGHILNHETLKDVYQWLLFTATAHDFYRRFGFGPSSRRDHSLEIRRERPER